MWRQLSFTVSFFLLLPIKRSKPKHHTLILSCIFLLCFGFFFVLFFLILSIVFFLCLIYACLDFGWNCKKIIDLVSVKRKSASSLNSIKTTVQINYIYIYLRISISLQAHSSDFDSFMIFQPFNTATTLLYLIFIRFFLFFWANKPCTLTVCVYMFWGNYCLFVTHGH